MSVIFQKIKEQILTKEEYIKNKDYEKSYSKRNSSFIFQNTNR